MATTTTRTDLIHGLRNKSLRIAELETELQNVRTFLQALATDTHNEKFCPAGFLQTVEQVIDHADKVWIGNDDNTDNVTPIRG